MPAPAAPTGPTEEARLLDAALALKDLPRAGWVRAGVAPVESVAAHAWGAALAALVACPPDLDRGRLLALVVIHDLAEVRVGDITPHDGVDRAEKARREAAAARELLAGRPDLLALWEEYEAGATPEARFARQLDRLDMARQARRYHRAGRLSAADLAEFLASARAGVTDPALRALLEAPPGA